MVRKSDFNESVSLPKGLTHTAIRKGIEYIERGLADLIDLYFERANVFSALVSIFGTKALDADSVYEKHRHSDTAQRRFPDLKRRGSRDPPAPEDSLESKASKRPWALQSHYDHPGWYIVWRYLVDPTCALEPNRPIIIWRVDMAFIGKGDWKYESSGAGDKGGGRTHTFGLRNPAKKLKGKAVYQRSDVVLSGGKVVPINEE
ncbi:MAG: hypothetical protein ACE5KF_03135 [Kiloniellaceae bacterium]